MNGLMRFSERPYLQPLRPDRAMLSGAFRWETLGRHWLVYLCLALIPVFVIALPVGDVGKKGAGDPHAGLVDIIGLPIMLLLMLRMPRSKIFFALFVFLSTAAISVLNVSESKIKTLALVYRLAAIYAPFALALSLHWTLESAERAARVFWWGGLLGCMSGFIVYWMFGAVREYQQALHLGAGSGGVVYRAGGALGNSGGFSHLICGWALSAICLRWLGFARLPKWQLLVTLAVLIYGILTTASRSSFLQVAVAISFSLLFMMRSGRSNAGRVMPVMGALALAVVLLLPLTSLLVDADFLQGVIERFGLTEQRSILQTPRWENWARDFEILGWTPFGIGYKTTSLVTSISVDNSYLRILFEEGLLGLASFLAFWLQVLFNLLAGHDNPQVRRIKAVAAGILMGELARMCFSDTFTMFLSTPTMAILMAIMLKLRVDTGDAPQPTLQAPMLRRPATTLPLNIKARK